MNEAPEPGPETPEERRLGWAMYAVMALSFVGILVAAYAAGRWG